jgi:hypothetical protein
MIVKALTEIQHYNDFFNSGAFPVLRAGNRAFRGSAIAPATPPPQGTARLLAAARRHPYNPVARNKNAFSVFVFSAYSLIRAVKGQNG